MRRRHRVLTLAFGLLAVAAAACSGATGRPAARPPISWSGQTEVETARVDMSGDYAVRWSTTPVAAGFPCIFYGYLWGAGTNVATIVSYATVDGDSHVHSLPADRYYFKGGSNCPWTVTLTPE